MVTSLGLGVEDHWPCIHAVFEPIPIDWDEFDGEKQGAGSRNKMKNIEWSDQLFVTTAVKSWQRKY